MYGIYLYKKKNIFFFKNHFTNGKFVFLQISSIPRSAEVKLCKIITLESSLRWLFSSENFRDCSYQSHVDFKEGQLRKTTIDNYQREIQDKKGIQFVLRTKSKLYEKYRRFWVEILRNRSFLLSTGLLTHTRKKGFTDKGCGCFKELVWYNVLFIDFKTIILNLYVIWIHVENLSSNMSTCNFILLNHTFLQKRILLFLLYTAVCLGPYSCFLL